MLQYSLADNLEQIVISDSYLCKKKCKPFESLIKHNRNTKIFYYWVKGHFGIVDSVIKNTIPDGELFNNLLILKKNWLIVNRNIEIKKVNWEVLQY